MSWTTISGADPFDVPWAKTLPAASKTMHATTIGLFILLSFHPYDRERKAARFSNRTFGLGDKISLLGRIVASVKKYFSKNRR
jgi:hypothetical protein